MDISVEVMLPPRGADFTTEMGNNHYRVLSPVAIYIPRKFPDTVRLQHTGFLHVTGFPDNHPSFRQVNREDRERRLNGVLGEIWRVPDRISQPQPTERRINGVRQIVMEAPDRLNQKRCWAGDPQTLPPQVRDALLNERQAEITWGQFKAFMRHQVRQVNLTDDDI
jgi:hypothetical protein